MAQPLILDKAAKVAFFKALYEGILGRHAGLDELETMIKRSEKAVDFDFEAPIVNALESEEFLRGKIPSLTMSSLITSSTAKEILDEIDIVSLGTRCATSWLLKEVKLKMFSGPFDWIFSNPLMIRDVIENDFLHFLDKEQYVSLTTRETHFAHVAFGTIAHYKAKYALDVIFNHHDLTHLADLEYIHRCVTRFRSIMLSEKPCLFVLISDTDALSANVFNSVRSILSHKRSNTFLLGLRIDCSHEKDLTEPLFLTVDKYPDGHLLSYSAKSKLGPLTFDRLADQIVLADFVIDYAMRIAHKIP